MREPADLLDPPLQVEVEGRLDLQSAAEGLAGAVAVDELLAKPRGEVGSLGVLLRGEDLIGLGNRLGLVLNRLLGRDEALLGHLVEHQVAPRGRRLGVGAR